MHLIPRRRFVKGLFLGTAFSSILGRSWSSVYAATYAPASQDATFTININDYPALLGEIGSVRLGVNRVGTGDNSFPEGPYYPVIINRDFSGNFYVLDATCTHAFCVVGALNTKDSLMHCPCHRSKYNIRGEVEDGPAQQPLTALNFSFDGTATLIITVPNMTFNVRSFLPNPNARLQLEFTAQGGTFYEVRFREKLTDPWQIAWFSLTPDGPANEQLLLGNGDPNTVYLDRTTPTGFYAVSMVLNEV